MRWRAVGLGIGSLLLGLATAHPAAAEGHVWTVEVEEPTGLERREGEVARLEASFAPGEAPGSFLMADAAGHEVPVQVEVRRRHPDGSAAEAEVLFPVTMIPGERPRFRLLAAGRPEAPRTRSRVGAPTRAGSWPGDWPPAAWSWATCTSWSSSYGVTSVKPKVRVVSFLPAGRRRRR